MTAGRSCPLHYRYSPEALYVVGGLYGNPEALDAAEALVAAEPGARVVFNGDTHWFDAEPTVFRAIQARVLAHGLTAGNVETELADPSSAGCGCAYPDYVSDAAVERSNAIMEQLKAICPRACSRELVALPMVQTVAVGDRRVGILHGDPASLAGWGLAAEALPPADPELHAALGCGQAQVTSQTQLADWFRRAGVDAFAATHTCLPVLADFAIDGGRRAVINNGSAGMPNFRDTRYGLASRIAVRPHSEALARLELAGLYLELVPLVHDTTRWWQRFTSWWPEGSPARVSYAARLQGDLAYRPEQAVRGTAGLVGV
jgi:hypothetical protein